MSFLTNFSASNDLTRPLKNADHDSLASARGPSTFPVRPMPKGNHAASALHLHHDVCLLEENIRQSRKAGLLTPNRGHRFRMGHVPTHQRACAFIPRLSPCLIMGLSLVSPPRRSSSGLYQHGCLRRISQETRLAHAYIQKIQCKTNPAPVKFQPSQLHK
jgi:hypothetical protein